MSSKTSADVLIGGKVYTLSGYESEVYLQQVASYINNKLNEFDGLDTYRRFPADMKATLVELNIADDYFKAKNQAEELEQDLDDRNKEIYDLKHELISVQIKLESLEKSAEELEHKNKELLLHKAKLETALEDTLLGKADQMPKKSIQIKTQEAKPAEKDTYSGIPNTQTPKNQVQKTTGYGYTRDQNPKQEERDIYTRNQNTKQEVRDGYNRNQNIKLSDSNTYREDSKQPPTALDTYSNIQEVKPPGKNTYNKPQNGRPKDRNKYYKPQDNKPPNKNMADSNNLTENRENGPEIKK